MRIVISGANNFIALALIKDLARKGCQIVACCRKPSLELQRLSAEFDIQILTLSFDGYEELQSRVGERADAFCHLAWAGTRGAARQNAELQERNVEASLAATRAMIELGCTAVLFAGSQAEYGPHDGPVVETRKCNPVSEYGRAKLRAAAEARTLCEAVDLRFWEARLFSVYGPGDRPETLVSVAIDRLGQNAPLFLSAGTQLWDYLYVDDAARALSTFLTERPPEGVYNLASGNVRPLQSYIGEMKTVLASNSVLHFDDAERPVSSCAANITKILSRTTWQPTVRFADGIARTAAARPLSSSASICANPG